MTVLIYAGRDLASLLGPEELEEYVTLYFQHGQGD